MTAGIFTDDNRRLLQAGIVQRVNAADNPLTGPTVASPRAAAEAIEQLTVSALLDLLSECCRSSRVAGTRRSMEDIYAETSDGYHIYLDVKSRRSRDTSFSLSNLTSVDRLLKLYRDSKNVFCLALVHYHVEGMRIHANSCEIAPIEWLPWDVLALGNLGSGQIQLKKSGAIPIMQRERSDWMNDFIDRAETFYVGERAKVTSRLNALSGQRDYWRI